MGGGNWLHDDSAVNGECHVIKGIHTATVYYGRFKKLTCGSVGGDGGFIYTNLYTYKNTHRLSGLITWDSFIILCTQSWPELEPGSHTSSVSCVFVTPAQWLSAVTHFLAAICAVKSTSTTPRYHLSNIHLLFLNSWVDCYCSLSLAGLTLTRFRLEVWNSHVEGYCCSTDTWKLNLLGPKEHFFVKCAIFLAFLTWQFEGSVQYVNGSWDCALDTWESLPV